MATTDSYKFSKCQRTKQILIDSWEEKYQEIDFKNLIDIEKLKTLGKLDYRNISRLGLLTDPDKAFISDTRRKVNNRRAAKRFRESEKSRKQVMDSTLLTLEEERNLLIREKESLIWEINVYHSASQLEEPMYSRFQYLQYPTTYM